MSTNFTLITSLGNSDKPNIEQHLLGLSKEDRYLRFFSALGDEQIKNYVASMDLIEGKAFAIVSLPHGEILGLAHVSRAEKEDDKIFAELGISIDSKFRGQGFGKKLMDRVISYCHTHRVNVLYMSCLRENRAMQKLARHFDLKIDVNPDEAAAELQIDSATALSYLPKEICFQQISLIDKVFRRNQKFLNSFLNLPNL